MNLERKNLISIVIPLFNEEKTIEELYFEINKSIGGLNDDIELIFINDGSTDNTLQLLLDLYKKDKRIKIINFSRNFGQCGAQIAGLHNTKGDAVILMDGDLQHPPKYIPDLIDKWKEGYDVVYTIRKKSADNSFLREMGANVFPKLLNYLSGLEIVPGAADFRITDRRVIESIRNFKEHNIYVRGIIFWMGYKTTSIEYNAPPRFAGKSHYNYFSLLRFSNNLIAQFSSLPLYFSAIIGLIISIISFLFGIFLIYEWIQNGRIPTGYTSILVAILFTSGIILVASGIIGIYIGKIYEEVKNRPRYIISEKFGF